MSLTFPSGCHPDDAKALTEKQEIRRFPFSKYYVIHLNQHAGKPAIPVVSEGMSVRRGQLIAKQDGFISAPIHSPVDGEIRSIRPSLDFNGKMTASIIIFTDPASNQINQEGENVDFEQFSSEQIIDAIKDMGMVGLGGAAFPTYVKLRPPKGKEIKTIILNGAECEPYLTSDHRVMLEQADHIILGARLLKKAVNADDVVIAIETNKPDAIRLLEEATQNESWIRVESFRTKYPQGAEKMLIKALMGKDVPSGGLPADLGILVSNIATVAEIGRLLPKGQGLIERVVTISGDGIKNPGNYLIPIGTPLDFILEYVGLKNTPYKIIFGGPMMGKTVSCTESPITKGTSGIVILEDDETKHTKEIFSCIHCARCVDVCPIQLLPVRLGQLARAGNYDEMTNYHLFDCFECGSCSYICPSNIPLVQYFRVSKQILRERQAHG